MEPLAVPQAAAHVPYHVFQKPTVYVLVLVISVTAMLSSLSSNVFFPAQRDIAKGLGVSPYIVNLSITTYLICQGISPAFWGPLADAFGRRVILLASLSVYIVANIAIALAPNAPVLLVFRAFQAAGSASTVSLGASLIADVADVSVRADYLGIFSGLRQFGLAFGPVLGGLLSGGLGWRSIFWFLVIVSATCALAILLLVPETLRSISGNGIRIPRSVTTWPLLGSLLPFLRPQYVSQYYSLEVVQLLEVESEAMTQPRKPFHWSFFLQPFVMLVEPDVACALFFGACCYTAWSMMIATTTVLLVHNYHFNTMQVGLCFLANGVGCVMGSLVSGRNLNASFCNAAQMWNFSNARTPKSPMPRPLPPSFPIEEVRLGDAPFYSAVMLIGFLIFGWSLTPPGVMSDKGGQTAGHWITPLLAQFLVGFSNTAVLNCNNTLVIDLFPGKSASASAIINLSRNLTAAVGVALVDLIEDATSPGWLGVALAALVVVGLAPLSLHRLKGAAWRRARDGKVERASSDSSTCS